MRDEGIGYESCEVDEEYVKFNLNYLIEQPNVRMFVDTYLHGVLIAHYAPEWYVPRVTVHEDLLYVHPAHRGGMTAFHLIKHMLKWAYELGASKVTAGVSTSSTVAGRLYTKMGYTMSGTTYSTLIGG
jgi:GNAT superfamily N-acetyltransferase